MTPTGSPALREWPRGVLNRDDTLALLKQHNAWRRGANGPQTDPVRLGLALDAVIAAMEAVPAAFTADDLRCLNNTDAGAKLAMMLRDGVRLGEFRAALVACVNLVVAAQAPRRGGES